MTKRAYGMTVTDHQLCPEDLAEDIAEFMWNSQRRGVPMGSRCMEWKKYPGHPILSDREKEKWRRVAATLIVKLKVGLEEAGWVIVPTKPTDQMLLMGTLGIVQAALRAKEAENLNKELAVTAWRMILGASPDIRVRDPNIKNLRPRRGAFKPPGVA